MRAICRQGTHLGCCGHGYFYILSCWVTYYLLVLELIEAPHSDLEHFPHTIDIKLLLAFVHVSIASNAYLR